jgi:phenylpropionate dioxygenase-like ring-hydroxylating dioxygenase large terminal subunit
MFISKEHHPQLLEPDCYRSPEQFAGEVAQLFKPAWHCVGLMSELPRDGSYRTFDLFGNPILLWHKDGQVHAYLNVCSHRYSMLTSKASGACDRLKCQYHGWEYDETGNVRKIPDARAFKPLEPGMLGLKKYHAETCGQLVFVSVADNPPSLREFLGSGYDLCQAWFHEGMHTAIVHDREIEANWKCLVENALESYHTTEVHPKTFGAYPDEDHCEHSLESRHTSFTASYADERSFRRWLDEFGHRMVGAVPTHQYQHILYYPNLMLSRLSLYKWIECIIPVSPTRSRSIVRLVCYAGRGKGALTRVRAFWVKRWANAFLMRVGAEDAALLPKVQRGLNAVDRPMGGLISTREERVFHFQRYLLDRAAGKSPACCEGCETTPPTANTTNNLQKA